MPVVHYCGLSWLYHLSYDVGWFYKGFYPTIVISVKSRQSDWLCGVCFINGVFGVALCVLLCCIRVVTFLRLRQQSLAVNVGRTVPYKCVKVCFCLATNFESWHLNERASTNTPKRLFFEIGQWNDERDGSRWLVGSAWWIAFVGFISLPKYYSDYTILYMVPK